MYLAVVLKHPYIAPKCIEMAEFCLDNIVLLKLVTQTGVNCFQGSELAVTEPIRTAESIQQKHAPEL